VFPEIVEDVAKRGLHFARGAQFSPVVPIREDAPAAAKRSIEGPRDADTKALNAARE
jgi:hypothetical protein